MDYDKYQQFVNSVTSDASRFHHSMITRLNSLQRDYGFDTHRLLTSVLGLCGEVGEYEVVANSYFLEGGDKQQVIDELGDIMWYVVQGAEALEIGLEDLAVNDVPQHDMETAAAELADITKKVVFHSKLCDDSVREKIKILLQQIYAQVSVEAEMMEVTIEDVVDSNIAKLSKRHAGGRFSTNYQSDSGDMVKKAE